MNIRKFCLSTNSERERRKDDINGNFVSQVFAAPEERQDVEAHNFEY